MTASVARNGFPAATHSAAAPRRRISLLSALVIGYVALLPYQFEAGNRINFAPADCFLLLVLLLAVGQLKYVTAAWSFWHFAVAIVFAIGSLVAALRYGELNRYELVNKDLGLLLPFLSYAAITTTVAEWDDLRRILRVFVWTVVLENIVALGAFLGAYFFGLNTSFARYEGQRLSGMLLDPNAYGGLLIVAFVIAEGASWGRDPLLKGPALWFCRLTLALGILFTFSRSAWLGLGLAMSLFFLIRPVIALRPLLGAVIGAPFLLLLMGHRFLFLFERMARRPEQVQERFDLIHDAIERFRQHPFLGGGLGSFRLSVGEIAHNTAMWFLADFGIVGLAVVLGFLGWFFAKGWFAYRFAPAKEQPLALALLLGHAAMLGLAMGIEAFYQRHWWLVFALIGSSYSLALRPAVRGRREAEVFAHDHT